jgi:hypothetical protein
MTQKCGLRIPGLLPLVFAILFLNSGSAFCQEKSTTVAKGTVGKLLPIPEEYKKTDVVAYFTLESPEGKLVEKVKTVMVTVHKDAKIERIEDGKRVAAKPADIKQGQSIELYDLKEAVRFGDVSIRIDASSIVVEERRK